MRCIYKFQTRSGGSLNMKKDDANKKEEGSRDFEVRGSNIGAERKVSADTETTQPLHHLPRPWEY